MSRGLGKVQRKVLEALRENKPDFSLYDYVIEGRLPLKFEGWYSIDSIMFYVTNEFDEDGDPIGHYEPTTSESQSVWRAVRQLEKRGLIESKIFPIFWEDRIMNRPEHCQGYLGKCKPGCANKQKAIRLVQQSGLVN